MITHSPQRCRLCLHLKIYPKMSADVIFMQILFDSVLLSYTADSIHLAIFANQFTVYKIETLQTRNKLQVEWTRVTTTPTQHNRKTKKKCCWKLLHRYYSYRSCDVMMRSMRSEIRHKDVFV